MTDWRPSRTLSHLFNAIQTQTSLLLCSIVYDRTCGKLQIVIIIAFALEMWLIGRFGDRSHENAAINIVASKTLFSRLRVFCHISLAWPISIYRLLPSCITWNIICGLPNSEVFFFNFLFIIILSLVNLKEQMCIADQNWSFSLLKYSFKSDFLFSWIPTHRNASPDSLFRSRSGSISALIFCAIG